MVSTNIHKESMVKRIEKVVSTLMEEDTLFKEDLDYSEMVEDVTNVFEENLSIDKFNNLSDASLKKRCSRIMSINLLAKIGEDFTPEEMAIFEEAIKRK